MPTTTTTSTTRWPRPHLTAPCRSIAYLATGALLGLTVLLIGTVLVTLSGLLVIVLVGIPLLAALTLSGIPLAALERRRLRLLKPAETPAPTPHRTPESPGVAAWFRLRLREQATWRELAYTVLLALVLWPLDLLVVACAFALPALLIAAPAHLAVAGSGGIRPAKLWLVDGYPAATATALLGLVLLLVLLLPLVAYAAARAAFTRLLLAPRESELADSLAEVTRSRARLVDAFEAERRRIERDLHDGAQQRLVALTMSLGLARLDAAGIPEGPVARRLADALATAHAEADGALTELRELIRGIHPQVLADYGLTAAIEDAADRSTVPVDIEYAELPRLPEPVESAGYFAVREALTNIDRHSGAREARITAAHTRGALRIDVRDDGRGGADPGRGTGLTGLADRLAVLDGRLTVTSPPGGPTVLSVEIPCQAEAR
ncbi:sensor histidine kinase [Streptomyces formicae]|uniref:histidine kinase n=1 Tax=Streptomyces formicae TaxID=1616117 RepID=A0A291Q873_9ACTN|nr:sensor histidine kinase [Streptomyces formicae]ATL28000.1 putative two-component system sensor kinase [Streptomyces formicae]